MDGLAQAIAKMRQAQEKAKKISTANDSKNSGYKCELCKDTGFVKSENGVKFCKCYHKKRYETQLKHSGLLKLKEKYRFDTYKTATDAQKTAKDKARNYTTKIKARYTDWFMAAGQSGAGKTHLCSAICFELLDAGIAVRYATYRELVNELKRYIMDDFEYNRIMNQYKNCTVLYLDDLYKGKPTDADLKIMFELLNYRYNNDKATIISTELNTRQLLDIEEAIGGRMIERIGTNLIKFEGKEMNYRLFGGK